MAKPDVKCGFSSANRMARMPVQSVAGIAVPSGQQPFVLEHESGGFFVSLVESGYEPPEGTPPVSLTQAMAQAKILACDLLISKLRDARRGAEAELGQGELNLDGDCDDGTGEDDEDRRALPQGTLALAPGEEPIEAEFEASPETGEAGDEAAA